MVAHNFILPSALQGTLQAGRGTRMPFAEVLDLASPEVLEFHDASGVVLRLRVPEALRAVVFPFYTVSQSESGLDLTYQGHALYLFYPLRPGWNRFVQHL